MKRCGLFYLAVALFCLLPFDVLGQKKEISKAEYLKAKQTAEANSRKFSHRIRSESRSFGKDDKKSFQFQKWIYEFQTPYPYRWLTETRKNNKTETTERVLIGNFEYTRTNNDEWKARRLHGGYNYLPILSIWEFNDEKFYVTENIRFNGQKANVYEYSAGTKLLRVQLSNGAPQQPIAIRHTEKHWVSPGGLLLKIEVVSNAQPTNLTGELISTISIYEYDPKIKIKAPIPEPKNEGHAGFTEDEIGRALMTGKRAEMISAAQKNLLLSK